LKRDDRGGLHSIQDALDAYLRAAGLGEGGHARVFRAWRDTVRDLGGEAMARRARPVRLRRGELVVEVDSAAHLQELRNFTGEAFRLRANERLGSELISSLVFKLKQ